MMTLAFSIKSPSYKLTVHKVKLKLHASSKLKQFSSLTATDRALENGWEKILRRIDCRGLGRDINFVAKGKWSVWFKHFFTINFF